MTGEPPSSQRETPSDPERAFIVIGGGPGGLTAAYELTKLGFRPTVLEKLDDVGGLARTASFKGFRFDLGGHRFYTKVAEIDKLWREVLGHDFIRRPRLSRIYYNGRFFHYPLRPLNALVGLGIVPSLLAVLSYLRWQLFPAPREDSFEQWVSNRFGRRLFETFFRTYTEKVWGIPCSALRAEWAAQRIKDLSLRTAILNMFVKPHRTIRTLIEEFDYPRLGPGMMWNAVKDEIERRGGRVRLRSDVIRIDREERHVESLVVADEAGESTLIASDFISSMPITELIRKLSPPAPADVLAAAARLTYRDFLTVCLIVNDPAPFPDNWIYVHSPEVKVGRIQNFRNWSPDMTPDPAKTGLGLEYFCMEGDDVWTTPDAELIELGRREVARIGLVRYEDVEDGCVVRVPKAYPVYDSHYREDLAVVRGFVEGFQNLQSIGRNGLHRYNNQDHSMLTGLLAVRNAVLGQRHDLWSVNTEPEYQETIQERAALPTERLAEALSQAFPKLDRVAFGVAVGLTSGLALLLATLVLILKGGEVVGPRLALLAQYFPGYTVTAEGSLLGLLYGFVVGFVAGWSAAFLRNATVFVYMAARQRRTEHQLMRKLLEYL
jgi:protoporphyrinogen oxidase